jgi:hypothetical protein
MQIYFMQLDPRDNDMYFFQYLNLDNATNYASTREVVVREKQLEMVVVQGSQFVTNTFASWKMLETF